MNAAMEIKREGFANIILHLMFEVSVLNNMLINCVVPEHIYTCTSPTEGFFFFGGGGGDGGPPWNSSLAPYFPLKILAF